MIPASYHPVYRISNQLSISLVAALFWFAGSTSLALPLDTPADTFHVYFLAGQSNMEGYGIVSELSDDLRRSFDDVWIFHGNTGSDDAPEADGRGLWAQLRPGHGVGFGSDGSSNTYSVRFGLELTFARHMQDLRPGERIALVKYARGGTAIDSAAAGRFGSWDPDYRGLTGINQYDHALATLRRALAASDVDGDGDEDWLLPAGILWMQGEADGAFSREIAARYRWNLERLMDLLRSALRVDDLPVVVGRISESGQDADGKVWDHGDVIRFAQADFVAEDERAALVISTDRYRYSDPWHYDSAGYLDLGIRFGEAMSRLRDAGGGGRR